MCGEYELQASVASGDKGSPPHVWRIPQATMIYTEFLRITSTCVENTVQELIEKLKGEDHLHMCGEYMIDMLVRIGLLGSPPHVWRIHRLTCWVLPSYGITSTCVENTVNKSLYSAK